MNINELVKNAINLNYEVSDFIGYFCQNLSKNNQNNSFGLLKELINTPQDKEWHSEGDVEIHTNMVLSEMYIIIKENNLNEYKAKILVLSALFHDICKPLVTKEAERDGKVRIISPKHEYLGRSYLLFELINIKDLSITEINEIINLVGYHNLPKLAVLRDDSINNFKKIARKANPEMLYYLELADMRGRTSLDQKESIELIELYKLYSMDHNVWSVDPYLKEKEFVNALDLKENQKEFILHSFMLNFENKKIFDIEEEIAKSYSYRDNFSELIILSGLSGTGKSTFSNNLSSDYNIINLDNIRLEFKEDSKRVLNHAKDLLKKYLAKNENVIIDATNYRKDFRDFYINLGFNYNAHTKNIVLLNDLKEILKNNDNRQYVVPESVIHNQKLKFQVPENDEAHTLYFKDFRK